MKSKNILSQNKLLLVVLTILVISISSGCGDTPAPSTISEEIAPAEPVSEVPDTHLRDADVLVEYPSAAAAALTVPDNPFPTLSVPTQITKVKDTYFIVDCYHNQVIYHDNLTDPLYMWQIMTTDMSLGHTLASDGTVYLVDDTENHRVLIFEEADGKYINTQVLSDIGVRPHYIVYNEANQTFYVWSSMTGEMYLLKREEDTNRVYLAQILSIPSLNGVYVRSFSITGDRILFVSGNSTIIEARLADFAIEKEYPVPPELAGMIQVFPIEDRYLITISTDVNGDQSFATILQCDSLDDLASGNYTDVYSNFVGGGTPYYLSSFEDRFYLTEHRVPGHSVWSFDFKDGAITDVVAVY